MTTLFLATVGGHLAQLHELSARVPTDGSAVWVTNAHEQSTSMLADRDVVFVPYVGVRNVSDVLRCVPAAHRLLRTRRITRAVSTGSGIALGYLPYLAARGVECHYIESATRVRGPSVTGRVLRWVPGVRTYTQYPHWASSRWHYAGSVFDGYQAKAHATSRITTHANPHATAQPGAPAGAGQALTGRIRVVVTVGAATEYPFRRLFTRLVPLLAPHGQVHQATGLVPEVLWQTGDTPVDDLAIEPTPLLPAAALADALAEADVVISHAGTGSALAILGAGRFPILVPRDHRHREAGDDHQYQLAAELARRGLCLSRNPDSITAEDLMTTRSTTVRRTAAPPPLALV